VNENGVTDITILGAGPTGLAAAYYAGHRDASVRIIESLEQLGGQVAAVYPEKHVYDVAGHPKIQGTKLIDLCVEQGLQYGPDVRLGEEVQTLDRLSQNGEELLAIGTDKGGPYLSRALIITAGHGAFEPRKLGIEGIDEWEDKGIHYFVREKDVFRDRTCVIVGGGDSALDWTLGLQDTARTPIALVHRRDNFRALESSVNEARSLEDEGRVRIFTPCEVRELHGDGTIQAVSIENTKTGETVGARARGQASDQDRPDHLRDDATRRVRGGRRRGLSGQDHADHDRHGRGRDRRKQRGRPHPRREGPAEVLD
jgi:ferredoxin/flavodoxin---NADP+ reductase